METVLNEFFTADAAPDAPQLLYLPDLATVHVTGEDAQAFLQGQLSCDMAAIGDDDANWASMNSAKGRVLAVLRVYRCDGGYALQTHRAVAEAVIRRLSMFVLRSRVDVEPMAEACAVGWLEPAAAATDQLRLTARRGATVCLSLPGTDAARHVAVGPPSDVLAVLREQLPDGGRSLPLDQWRAIDIATGLPEIVAETQDRYVAQMLDLDHLGALSWTKGCYTGQEVIARLHYRGGIKRRLFHSGCDAPAPPGTTIRDPDGNAVGEVLQVASVGNRWHFAAVIKLDCAGRTDLQLDTPERHPIDPPAPPAGRRAPAES